MGIYNIEVVGNYALRIMFDDLHETGIYSWKLLHTLGKQKYSRTRAYVKQMKEAGLSRHPKKKVTTKIKQV